MQVRKTVDVFLKELVASHPVVVEAIDGPADDDFVARVKEQMQGHYSSDDIQSARFLVRSVLEWQAMFASEAGRNLPAGFIASPEPRLPSA